MDELTHIEKFNNNLRLFVLNIISTFPEFSDILNEYYKELLETDQCSDSKYVKRYMLKMSQFKKQISSKDDSMFKESVFVLKNVDFQIIWESEELSSSNKDKIWRYIQTLFVLGDIIISSDDKVKEMLDTFNNKEVLEDIDGTMKTMMENLSQHSEEASGFFETDEIKNSTLGKFASEMAADFDPKEMFGNMDIDDTTNPMDLIKNLMGGDGLGNLMGMFNKVGEQIKSKMENNELNQEDLLRDAQNMMGKLNNFMPPTNPTQERLKKKLEQRKKEKEN